MHGATPRRYRAFLSSFFFLLSYICSRPCYRLPTVVPLLSVFVRIYVFLPFCFFSLRIRRVLFLVPTLPTSSSGRLWTKISRTSGRPRASARWAARAGLRTVPRLLAGRWLERFANRESRAISFLEVFLPFFLPSFFYCLVCVFVGLLRTRIFNRLFKGTCYCPASVA